MRIEKFVRPFGRIARIVAALAVVLSMSPAPSFADEPVDSVLQTVSAIRGMVNCYKNTDGTYCGTPLDALPCYVTGECPVPPVNPPPVPTSEITSVQTVMVIGNIKQDLSALPGTLNPTLNLLGYCQPFLDQFLGNTEFLGPLLQYESCLVAGSVPAVLATLPAVSGGVSFLAGACQLRTEAYEAGYPYSPYTNFRGITDCRTASSFFQAGVWATAKLQDFFSPADLATAPLVYGTNYAESSGFLNTPLAYAGSGTAKVQLGTTIAPSGTCSGASNVCQIAWVALPNKNPDTAVGISCDTPLPSKKYLHCFSKGIPMTSETVARRP